MPKFVYKGKDSLWTNCIVEASERGAVWVYLTPSRTAMGFRSNYAPYQPGDYDTLILKNSDFKLISFKQYLCSLHSTQKDTPAK